jgi:hypothetical protein
MTPKTVLILMTSLAAFALYGCGDDSSSIAGPGTTAVDTVPPAVPTNVEVHALTSSVNLSWAENSEPDLAGYVLQRSLDDGASWETIGTALLTSASYTDTKNRAAQYRVAATDLSSNQSAFSTEVGYRSPNPKPKYQSLPALPSI